MRRTGSRQPPPRAMRGAPYRRSRRCGPERPPRFAPWESARAGGCNPNIHQVDRQTINHAALGFFANRRTPQPARPPTPRLRRLRDSPKPSRRLGGAGHAAARAAKQVPKTHPTAGTARDGFVMLAPSPDRRPLRRPRIPDRVSPQYRYMSIDIAMRDKAAASRVRRGGQGDRGRAVLPADEAWFQAAARQRNGRERPRAPSGGPESQGRLFARGIGVLRQNLTRRPAVGAMFWVAW
jgi:hypothetical protein